MKDETFRYIWDNSVVPSINRVKELCDKIDGCESYNLKVRNLGDVYNRVSDDYELIRRKLKDRYYKAERSDDEMNLIDSHKISACLCYSLICNKPFSFLIKEDMPKDIFLCNYSAAYYASLGLVYTTLIAEYKINGYEDFSESLINWGKLYEPPVSVGHNTYHEGRIYALAQNDIYGNTFDILDYSDMMYWLELYTRQQIEKTIDPVPLDRVKLEDK